MKNVLALSVIFATFCLLQVTSSESVDKEWTTFKTIFNKVYDTPEEEAYRKSVFTSNFNRVSALNEFYKKYEARAVPIQVSWADRTEEEFYKTPEGIKELKNRRQ